MRWDAKRDNGWRNAFALLPVRIGDQWLWWEWYKRKLHAFGFGHYWENAFATEWPHCCDEMRGEMYIGGQHAPEWCPVHSPRS